MEKPCGVVAVLTDFGYEDYYVAAMKGVILDTCRDVRIVDVTHSVRSFNLHQAAFTLYAAYRYFPAGTIFLVVVDPGVGSGRKALLVVSRRYYFIGPDNGILMPAAKHDGIEKVHLIENDIYFRKPVSRSFHGRDVFAPIAARIACGLDPSHVGKEISMDGLIDIDIGFFMERKNGCVKLKVVHIDKFGNIMLSQNFTDVIIALNAGVGDEVYVHASGATVKSKILEVFSKGMPGELVLYENSLQLAELAVNMGSAEKLLSVSDGDMIEICSEERR